MIAFLGWMSLTLWMTIMLAVASMWLVNRPLRTVENNLLHRPRTDQIIRAHAKTVIHEVDWYHVRSMELDVYGRYYHTLDGQPVAEDDWLARHRAAQKMFSEARSMTVEDIRNMNVTEYARFRSAYVKHAEDRGDRITRGIFG